MYSLLMCFKLMNQLAMVMSVALLIASSTKVCIYEIYKCGIHHWFRRRNHRAFCCKATHNLYYQQPTAHLLLVIIQLLYNNGLTTTLYHQICNKFSMDIREKSPGEEDVERCGAAVSLQRSDFKSSIASCFCSIPQHREEECVSISIDEVLANK